MTVKDRVGRPRHVAFAVREPVARAVVLRALAAALPFSHRLTAWDGREGLVRVKHAEQKRAVESLAAHGFEVRGVSGTIRAARRKFLSRAR